MWEYNKQIFKNQKEVKDKLGISGAVFRAKVRDGEIKRINNNTGLKPYETLYSNTEKLMQ